jgi:hypothetical protein
MRKLVLLLIVFALAALAAYKLFSGKSPKAPERKDAPLRISKNSSVFNTAFTELLSQYYSLKDALVEWDTLKADQAAYALANKADSLPLKQIKGDSSIVLTAQSLAASMQGDAKGLVGDTGIEAKRRDFNMITDELYNLIRTVRYDGETIYHVRCPMAFKDSEEGYWLSNVDTVINPYLGKKHPKYKDKMLGCGEVNDSLSFAK